MEDTVDGVLGFHWEESALERYRRWFFIACSVLHMEVMVVKVLFALVLNEAHELDHEIKGGARVDAKDEASAIGARGEDKCDVGANFREEI
ncbi:hypothetical protein GOBAR_DD27988 [Gossypium barbadense]|nr:hypothetical protein GOBAR_DD27988 [Gossypium barbadense]